MTPSECDWLEDGIEDINPLRAARIFGNVNSLQMQPGMNDTPWQRGKPKVHKAEDKFYLAEGEFGRLLS